MVVYLGRYAYSFTGNPKFGGKLLIHREGEGYSELSAAEYERAVQSGVLARLESSAMREYR